MFKFYFLRKLAFWIILIQFFAALVPLSTRLPFPEGWTNLIPGWKKVNKAFEKIKPTEQLKEQFLAKEDEGFNEILEIIDRNFIELPRRDSIRGITNRTDMTKSGSGNLLAQDVSLWLDFGGEGYLYISSREEFWDKVRSERVTFVLWGSLGLLFFSLILRYIDFARLQAKKN